MKEYRQKYKKEIKDYNYKYNQKHGQNEKRKLNTKHYRQSEKGKISIRMSNKNRRHLKRASGVKITVEQWRDLCERFNNRCAYCGIHEEVLRILHNQNLTTDHIIPISRGGEHSISNIVPACMDCNVKKGNK